MIEGGGVKYPNCRQTRHDGDLPQGQVTHRKSCLRHTPYVCRVWGLAWETSRMMRYTRLFPDPRFLLFVLQNISGYKNAVECLLQ